MIVCIKSCFENDTDVDILEVKEDENAREKLDTRIEYFKSLFYHIDSLAQNYYRSYRAEAPISDEIISSELSEKEIEDCYCLGYIRNNKILESPFTEGGNYMYVILDALIDNFPEDYSYVNCDTLEYSME